MSEEPHRAQIGNGRKVLSSMGEWQKVIVFSWQQMAKVSNQKVFWLETHYVSLRVLWTVDTLVYELLSLNIGVRQKMSSVQLRFQIHIKAGTENLNNKVPLSQTELLCTKHFSTDFLRNFHINDVVGLLSFNFLWSNFNDWGSQGFTGTFCQKVLFSISLWIGPMNGQIKLNT